MRFRPHCAALLAVVLGACSYTSQYVPPQDGRARLVWRDGNPVALVPSNACRAQAFSAASLVPAPQVASATPAHAPRVYVHHAHWIDAPVYAHHVHAHHHVHRGPPVGAPVHAAVPAAPVHQAVPAGASDSTSKADVSKAKGGSPEAWVVATVAALVVMPAIAVGLAVSPAEDAPVAAGSVDLVNAYNDVARAPGSPCAPPSDLPLPPPPPPAPPSSPEPGAPTAAAPAATEQQP